MRVRFLRVDMLEFAVEDEAVSERAQRDGDGLAEQGVREDRSILQPSKLISVRSRPLRRSSPLSTHLLAILEQELVGIHAVRDGAPDDGNIVEDDWGPREIPRPELWTESGSVRGEGGGGDAPAAWRR